MRPQEPTDTQKSAPSRDISVPTRDAAVNLVRSQIDALYSGRSLPETDDQSNQTSDQRPEDNTPPTQAQPPQPANEPWRQYHDAWQDYYQKYYQQYYTGHVHRIVAEERQKLSPNGIGAVGSGADSTNDDTRKVNDLRTKLQDQVTTNAKKIRKSRHFIPLISAVVVMGVFAFLQYNSILIGTVQAYVSPGTIDPQNIVVDPTASVQVSQDPKLIIPKINVDVPAIYNVANTHDAQMAAMQNGVAHFAVPGADSVPGQIGNTTFSGHSSNDLFEPGDYKFVFSQLDKLQDGDTIYVNYQGTRYTYSVTKKEVVSPSNVQALTYKTDKPVLTLITCTPLGTATNRLLVTAEQISPDPSKAAPANSTSTGSGSGIPGNSPSALEKLFGSKG